ncbi:DUF6716 putative glycosyltransferase [Streptomyces xiamenensis]|uniref:DUF6716 putative glycosyltransferase n=1 Tax=Streptomyces xiamenensis TaxID=408015 RepID=UPI0036F0105F
MPSPSPHDPPRVAVLADSDTRWKWGAHTARRLVPGAIPQGFLLRGRATPTARQLAESGADAGEAREITAADFLTELGRGTHQVLILACVGGTVQALLHALADVWKDDRQRPVVVTGYVGVVYEKLTDGLLLRHGADVVLANSPYDVRRFRAVYEGVRADASAVTECALPFLGGERHEARPRGTDRPYRLVFAVQPSVPGSRADRAYLLERAMAHARRHPGREVVVKLRSRPGEQTTHVEELPYQRLAERARDRRPDNFSLAYGNMGEVLDTTDLLVTVSSTAALESLHRGIPTAILTDLGIREPLGNHYFTGSGCFASWDELDAGYRPEPDQEWLADQGLAADPEQAYGPARERLSALLSAPRPPLTPYYTRRTAPGYLPGILARHDTAAPASTHRLLRQAARATYRTAAQRIAPIIRRWGQL